MGGPETQWLRQQEPRRTALRQAGPGGQCVQDGLTWQRLLWVPFWIVIVVTSSVEKHTHDRHADGQVFTSVSWGAPITSAYKSET